MGSKHSANSRKKTVEGVQSAIPNRTENKLAKTLSAQSNKSVKSFKRQNEQSANKEALAGRTSIQRQNMKNELTEIDYQFHETQTKLSREEIKNIFDKFHENNPNNRLDRVQFAQLYKSLRPEPEEMLQKISEQIFRAFDLDNNGYLEFNEFLIGYVLTSRGDLKMRLEYAFWLYDKDRNGYLDYKEVEAVIQCMICLFGIENSFGDSTALADLCIDGLDKSKDNKISKEEFIEGLTKNYYLRGVMSPFN